MKLKKPNTRWTHQLSIDPWPYADEIVLFEIKGLPEIHEFEFLHLASKTLYLCDLVFNIRRTSGLGAWLVLHLFGTYHKLAVSRFFMRHVKDFAAFKKSVKQIFSHEFENLIVSHGDAIEGNAKHLLGDALEKIEI